jgi:hypothetical protein
MAANTNKVEIIVPTSPQELPMRRYQEYHTYVNEIATKPNKEMEISKIISILSGCKQEYAMMIPVAKISKVVQALISSMNDVNRPLIKVYEFDSIKYMVEPKLDSISFGMLADLTSALSTPETWHKALAILYRPVKRETKYMGGLYAIERYDADNPEYEQRQHIFANAPCSLFLGVRAFFLNGSAALESYTHHSLTRQLQGIKNRQTQLKQGR